MTLKNTLNKQPKVAVFGDLALDRYIMGDTKRMSSEAPIPVLNATSRRVNMACAANTVMNLKAMGAKPFMVGRIGLGEYGDAFKKTAFAHNISLNYTVSEPEDMTAKTRIMAQGQQIARFDEEYRTPLTPEIRAALLEKLKLVRAKADIIVLSDYGYLTLDEEMISAVNKLWANGVILHDPQAFHAVDLTGVTAITPNLKEAKFILQNTSADNSDTDVATLAAELIEKFKLEYVLFTRSEKGMSLFTADGDAHHVSAEAQEVYDVSGAGDSVVAAFSTALARGYDKIEAMHLSNLAGSVAVTKRGVQTVTWEEVMAFDAHIKARDSASKQA